jgi:putative heme-binding domain-containing protein
MESLVGDAANGRRHFQALCASCHRVRGEGNEVGPDLGMVATKPADWLLTAILDPNQSVEARYRSWTVKLKSSDELSGLLSAETANNIVLRLSGGTEHAVLRGDIASMEPMKLSLMPTGLESALKPQDMADLVRWLRAP